MTVDDAAKSKIRAVWEAAAPGWAKWESKFSTGLERATLSLLDAVDMAEGARVLDVASGAGAQTMLASARVGSAGSVVASDISAAMLEHLRSNTEAHGITNVETVVGTAEEVAMAHGPFDAAICRLGLMLFPDPVSSVTAIRAALKPGGRFGAMVFAAPAENPFFSETMKILLRHADKTPPTAGQPGLFALSQPGALDEVFATAGLEDIKVEKVVATVRLAGADEALAMIQQAFGAYRAVVADLNEAARAAAWAEVLAFLRSIESGAALEGDAVVWIGAGRRPA